jgi:hypothetical protein
MQVDEADGLTNMLMAEYGADVALDTLHELRVGWEVEKTLAAINQRRIAQSVERLEKSSVEGLGQHTHSVDLFAFLYWHARTNGECWRDQSFWDEFARDNPAARVRSKPAPNRISHPGLPILNNRSHLPKVKPRVELTGLN